MKTLLFLAHRIPYPPNKGDKIRSYHLLRFLSEHFRVALGAFVDSAEDWRFREHVAKYCAEIHLVPLNTVWARSRSLRGFVSNEPLTLPYYRSDQMAAWVRSKFREGVQVAVAFSSSMAQYLEPLRSLDQRIVDFVDLDSEKWKQYGAARRGVLGAIYRREGRLLARYERSIAAEFSASVFVSAAEAEPVLHDAPDLAARIHSIGNGVDSDFFDPTIEMGNPFPVQDNVAVFTGAMDYWANVDAVSWFAKHVWSRVAREEPTARFCIVGARPTKEVRALERLPGVTVVGAVPDVRPYLKFASLAVAPLRVARGIQNKVLEALAMGLPVVATRAVGDGLSPSVAKCVEVADEAAGFASLVLSQIRSPRSVAVAARNRNAVVAAYDWRQSAREWARLLKVSEMPTALPAAESALQ